MMLLLPISHEDAVVRRMPWVSLGILGVCVALQIHSCTVSPDLERRAYEVKREMLDLEQQALTASFKDKLDKWKKNRHQKELDQLGAGKVDAESEPSSDDTWDLPMIGDGQFRKGELTAADDPLYVRYKALEAELEAIKRELPVIRFGYRPALDGITSLVSSMFAHGGWLHLLSNMWFLCLVGCNLEDRWGRWQFVLFYLVAGVVAALTFTALHPFEKTSLVGASGAVAGAMGAFMFCFARTKVKIFYLYMLLLTPRYGTFRASAWMVLAFWVGQELLMTVVEASSNTGVAHSAHAGGFLFGGAIAFLLRHLGVDSQLDEASERAAQDATVVFQEHPLYVQAVRQRAEGQDEPATEALVRLVSEAPDHAPAHELLLEIGLAHRDLRCVDFGLPFTLEHHQRTGDDGAMVAAYRELRRALPDYGLLDKELLRVATAANKLNDGALVIQVVSELMQQHPNSPALPRAIWLAAQAQAAVGAVDLQRDTLRRLLQRYPQHAVATLARGELQRMGAAS